MLAGVSFEQLTTRPLDCQEMKPAIGLSNLYCADYVGVYDAGTILGLSYEARNSCSVEAKFLSENLQRHYTVRLVSGFVDSRGPALANLTLDGVPGYL
jgi:hypothetical protein